MDLKKGTQVKIITGKDKGKTGEVLEIDRKLKKIKVKTINMIKRHLKPTKEKKRRNNLQRKLYTSIKCEKY